MHPSFFILDYLWKLKVDEDQKKSAHPWAGKWRVWGNKKCLTKSCGNPKCTGLGSFTLKPDGKDDLVTEDMNYVALRDPFSDDPFTYSMPSRIKNASISCKSPVNLEFKGDTSCGINSINLTLQLRPDPTTGSINTEISCFFDVRLGSLYHRKGWDDFYDRNVPIWITRDE